MSASSFAQLPAPPCFAVIFASLHDAGPDGDGSDSFRP